MNIKMGVAELDVRDHNQQNTYLFGKMEFAGITMY